nr:peroxidase 4-like [Ipomoea trifida]
MMKTTIPSSIHIHVAIMLFSLLGGMSSAQLSANFYSKSCPNALSIIKSGVISAIKAETRMGASLLRLHFHDCFVNGCDGSILLDDTPTFTGEQTSKANNNSIRGLNVIDNIKAKLESCCPGVVSCADIVAVAARDSTVVLGGPSWNVLLGRRDSTTASISAADNNLPAPTLNLNQLISSFSKHGFSARELVALSGGHTIGKARCTTFRARIYNDTNIDPSFASSLQAICPRSGGDNNLTPMDPTPTVFDNCYFRDLLKKKGLFHSDQALYNGGSTDSIVKTYTFNPSIFSKDFADAMLKMSNLGPLTGTNGQIRKNCGKVN